MISIRIIRIADYVVIGISGSAFLLCLASALYSVPWNRARRRQEVTRDFHLFWKTRAVLQLASALWMLAQWLRLTALWQPGSQIFPGSVTAWTGNGTLCRVYLSVSLGLLEPFCLFTAVLLCRSVRSKRRPQDAGWPNAWVLGLALLLAAPFAAAQTVAAWMSVIVRGRAWESVQQVGTYFLAPYVVGSEAQCDRTAGQRCLLCFFPAANSITGIASGAVAAALLWGGTQRMIRAAINRRLRLRLRCFQLAFVAVVAAAVATRAAAVVRGTPFAWAFQVLWLAHFTLLPLLVATYSLFLVVLPTLETDRVAKRIQKAEREAQAASGQRWKQEAGPAPSPSPQRPAAARAPSHASSSSSPAQALLAGDPGSPSDAV